MKSPLLLVLFLASALHVAAQSPITAALSTLLQDPAMAHASLSFCALDINSGETFAEYDSRRSLIPASSLKVVTTAAALALLGADYRYKTELQYDGSITAEGTLSGNLILKGYGDPTLGAVDFEGATPMNELMELFVKTLVAKGVKQISGDIVGDGSFFNNDLGIGSWAWEDVGSYYGVGPSGLNLHDNHYYITYTRRKEVGVPLVIEKIFPSIPFLEIESEVVSGEAGSGDNAYIYGGAYSNLKIVRGTLPAGAGGFSIKGAIPDPPLFAAATLKAALEKQGIKVEGKAITHKTFRAAAVPTVLYTYRSPTLAAIVKRANHYSVNLYCEVMLLTIAQKVSGKADTEAGIAAIADFWKARGIETDGFFQMDGSGLSPRNGISARCLASILRKADIDLAAFPDFRNSLPLAGKTGTIAGLFKGTPAENNLRAKSGSLTRARSYSGFVRTVSGKNLTFSVIVNNFTGKDAEMVRRLEKLLVALTVS